MCALQLPEIALHTLGQPWPTGPSYITETPKWLIYSLDSAPQEANELYCAVRTLETTADSVRLTESEWDEEVSWLRPANQDFAAPDLQHILDHHFRLVEHQFMHPDQVNENGWMAYDSGFIVITEENWREHGVTAVHCDKDRLKWKVTKCDHIPVDQLSMLAGIVDGDEHFDDVRGYFDDGSGNDGPDNQGGPAPVGEWQFAVYCTGPSEIGARQLQQSARANIPDPRGDYSYKPGEASLDFLSQVLPPERVSEDWPFTYARLMNTPTVAVNGEPKICKLHPSLFVHIQGDLSKIEIVKMEWDHKVTGSEEELRRIGRESKTITQKCEAAMLVTSLEQLARGM